MVKLKPKERYEQIRSLENQIRVLKFGCWPHHWEQRGDRAVCMGCGKEEIYTTTHDRMIDKQDNITTHYRTMKHDCYSCSDSGCTIAGEFCYCAKGRTIEQQQINSDLPKIHRPSHVAAE